MRKIVKRRRAMTTMALLLGGALLLVANPLRTAAPNTTRAKSVVTLHGAGSTFIFPLMQQWVRAYDRRVNGSVSIQYLSIGSGEGIQYFSLGAVDFGTSDAYLTTGQMVTAGGDTLHLPLTLAPTAIVYNLPTLTTPLRLDGVALAEIYLGHITRWDDTALAALNPGVRLPHQPIAVVHRSDGSGTSFIFTSYLSAVSSVWQGDVGSGTLVYWPRGVGGRGNDGVASLVKHSVGSIGYVAPAYALSEHLSTAQVKNRAGQFLGPSIAGAEADAANADVLPGDLRASIVDAPGVQSYPISGFTWALIHQQAPDHDQYAALLKFLWWCVHDGQTLASRGTLGYAGLPASIVRLDEVKLESVTFKGAPLFAP